MAKSNVSQFSKCANCGACVNICPMNAITVDKKNMYYTLIIDEKKCVGCGKCVTVCPVNTPIATQNLIAAYYGYVDDDSVLYSSSSGGMFYAIAKLVLDEGGVVFGASFSDDKHSVIFSSTDTMELCDLQKSKYVESDIGNTFKCVKENLMIGRRVLFCGTPCQSSGLKRFLGKEYENLIVCDFSCGGLPSHKMYQQYLQYLENRFASKVEYVDFRPKNFGWATHSIYIKFKNRKEYTKLATLDPYYRAFFKSLSKRDYCYECDFANNHAADIVLADFWLYKKLSNMNNQNRGISLVLTNTEKGEDIIRELTPNLVLKTLSLEKGTYNIKCGHLTKEATERHVHFVDMVQKKGFIDSVNMEIPLSLRNDWKQMIKQLIRKGNYEKSKKTRD